MKRTYFKAIPYGLGKSVAISFLLELSVSKLGENLSVEMNLLISFLLALLSAVAYFSIISKEKDVKTMGLTFLTGLLSYAVGMVILIVASMLMRVNPFGFREAASAEGLLLILFAGFFTVISVAFELGMSIALLIKRKN